jgi:hypothetical protein
MSHTMLEGTNHNTEYRSVRGAFPYLYCTVCAIAHVLADPEEVTYDTTYIT